MTLPKPRSSALLAFSMVLALAGCRETELPSQATVPSTPAEVAALAHYNAAVLPVLKDRCYQCHAALQREGGFRLDTRARLLHGGKHGKAVVPGDPDASLLLKLVRHQGPKDHPMPMPQKSESDGGGADAPLSAAEIAEIAQWVRDGVPMTP